MMLLQTPSAGGCNPKCRRLQPLVCLGQAAASAFIFYDLDSSGLLSKAEIMKMIELQPIGSHYECGPRGHTCSQGALDRLAAAGQTAPAAPVRRLARDHTTGHTVTPGRGGHCRLRAEEGRGGALAPA